ncbi:MAG: threonine synthase [Mariprofundaceae bacterium]
MRDISEPACWIVTDALIEDRDSGFALHPALDVWRQALLRRLPRWHTLPDRTPLEWAASLAGRPSAACVAQAMGGLPETAAQCWVATPYHAMLGRDSVRVMPEGLFPWDEAAARALAGLLRPVLEPHGMTLYAHGAAMLLCCRAPMDAAPPSFAVIGGALLPNRHPPGADGGALMRLMAEIQMHLHRHPLPGRDGLPPVTGLWLWGAWSPAGDATGSGESDAVLRVVTRNPALAAISDGRGARILISEADRLTGIVRAGARPPDCVVLAGAGRAVVLRRSWWAWRQAPLRPSGRPADAVSLERMLRAWIEG